MKIKPRNEGVRGGNTFISKVENFEMRRGQVQSIFADFMQGRKNLI